MLRVLIAILVAALTAALVAVATEPVAAVGAPESQPAAKGDRLDAGQRANCSREQADLSSRRQCRREGVTPIRRHTEVRIAWSDFPLIQPLAS